MFFSVVVDQNDRRITPDHGGGQGSNFKVHYLPSQPLNLEKHCFARGNTRSRFCVGPMFKWRWLQGLSEAVFVHRSPAPSGPWSMERGGIVVVNGKR